MSDSATLAEQAPERTLTGTAYIQIEALAGVPTTGPFAEIAITPADARVILAALRTEPAAAPPYLDGWSIDKEAGDAWLGHIEDETERLTFDADGIPDDMTRAAHLTWLHEVVSAARMRHGGRAAAPREPDGYEAGYLAGMETGHRVALVTSRAIGNGPYRVDEPTPDSGTAMGEGPSVLDAKNAFVCEANDAESARRIVAALNEQHARLIDTPAAPSEPVHVVVCWTCRSVLFTDSAPPKACDGCGRHVAVFLAPGADAGPTIDAMLGRLPAATERTQEGNDAAE